MRLKIFQISKYYARKTINIFYAMYMPNYKYLSNKLIICMFSKYFICQYHFFCMNIPPRNIVKDVTY